MESHSAIKNLSLKEVPIPTKEETIDYLIDGLIKVDEISNGELISVLKENKDRPIKEIRDLIQDIEYEINPEYDFCILNSLFNIYYSEPEWGWE